MTVKSQIGVSKIGQPQIEWGEDGTSPDPTEALIHFIVTFLAAMIMANGCSDMRMARAAAFETIMSFRATTMADLMIIAQIVAFGFVTLRTLAAAMADEMPPDTLNRLNAGANALNRSEHRNRQALAGYQRQALARERSIADRQVSQREEDEAAEATADIAKTDHTIQQATNRAPQPAPSPTRPGQQQPAANPLPTSASAAPVPVAAAPIGPANAEPPNAVAQTQTTPTSAMATPITATPVSATRNVAALAATPAKASDPLTAAPTSVPIGPSTTAAASVTVPVATAPLAAKPAAMQPAPPAPRESDADARTRIAWAEAMNDVAKQFMAECPGLPAQERRANIRRAELLSTGAQEVLSGAVTFWRKDSPAAR